MISKMTFPAPSFGSLEGPVPENTQGGAVIAHPCFAARALHGFLTNDVNELTNTSQPECFPSCPALQQTADPVTPASSTSTSSRVSSALTTPATSVHSLPPDRPALRLTIPPPPASPSQSTSAELSPVLSADIEAFDNPLDFIRSRTRERLGLNNALTHKSLSSWQAHVLSLMRQPRDNRARMFLMRGPDTKALSQALIELLIEGHSGQAGLSIDRQTQLDVRISTVSDIHRIFQGEVCFTSYVSLFERCILS